MLWRGFLNLFEDSCAFFDADMAGVFVPLKSGSRLLLEDAITPATLVCTDGAWMLRTAGRADIPAQGVAVCCELSGTPADER